MLERLPCLAAGGLLLAVLLAATPGHANDDTLPGYRWEPLGDGIFLHSRTDPLAGPIDGNSVVVVNDDGVLVIDTHINPAAARAVIARIRRITDQAVTHVVNTHWHDDHVNGNYVYRDAFPDARIIAHRATLVALQQEWQPMLEQRRDADKHADPETVRRTADDMSAADPTNAQQLRVFADYVEALRPELPGLRLEFPDRVFGHRLELEFSGRRVHLEWLGRGNTDGDMVAWLPDDKVLVTGDLVVAPIPYAFSSPMLDWPRTLARLEDYDADVIVPGHGPVQRDTRHIRLVRELIEQTVAAVREAHANGATLRDMPEALDLSAQAERFTGGDPNLNWAWESFYLQPAARSAWFSLGLPLPDKKKD